MPTVTNPIPNNPHNFIDYYTEENMVQLLKMTDVVNAYGNYLQDNSKIIDLNTKVTDMQNNLSKYNTMFPLFQNLKNNDFDASHNQLVQYSRDIAETRKKYDVLLNELYYNENMFDNTHPYIDVNLVSGVLWTTLISSVIYLLVKYL
jgi:hypothetical protein